MTTMTTAPLTPQNNSTGDDYRLLVKFPTRGRPEKFFKVFDRYYRGCADRSRVKFLITVDCDDESMRSESVVKQLRAYENITVCYGHSKSKIEAVNADMHVVSPDEYDIILLASDDMVPEVKGYDRRIREEMAKTYPDTDGVLWFFDGYRRDFNTLSILGRKYYERFGYIYHPGYKSFWCDNEFTEVANRLGKQTFIDQVIIRHVHPDWISAHKPTAELNSRLGLDSTGPLHDATFMKNLPYEQHDRALYQRRLKEGFSNP